MVSSIIDELALAIAIALGLKDVLAALLKQLAGTLRARYRATKGTEDDAPLELAARLAELAAEAARNGDILKVKQLVKAAHQLPPPKA